MSECSTCQALLLQTVPQQPPHLGGKAWLHGSPKVKRLQGPVLQAAQVAVALWQVQLGPVVSLHP